MHQAGISVRGRVGASEDDVPDEELEDRIVSWPVRMPESRPAQAVNALTPQAANRSCADVSGHSWQPCAGRHCHCGSRRRDLDPAGPDQDRSAIPDDVMSSSRSTAPHGHPPGERQRHAAAPVDHATVRSIIVGIMLAMFLSALEQTIVAPALPTIGRSLSDVENLSWVVTAYLLSTTVATPLFGKLSDIYGRRAMMLISVGIFIARLGRLRAGADACGR